MAIGKLIRVDFDSVDCPEDEMMLFISTPQGGVVHGPVYWCMDNHIDTELAKLRACLRNVRDYAADHHADEPSHTWLHSLTVDIPNQINHVLGVT